MHTIKLIFILFFLCNFSVAAKNSENHIDKEQLRLNLNISPTQGMNADYSKTYGSYIDLMLMGQPGFEILSEAWAYDHIIEDNWLNWRYDFLTRYDRDISHKSIADYESYVSKKLEFDEKFAKAILDKFLSIEMYMATDPLLHFLEKGEGGYKRVAYMALKTKFPNLPKFDYGDSKERQADQIKQIMIYVDSLKQ